MISVGGRAMDERAIYACVNYACRESKLHRNGKLVNYDGSGGRDKMESLEVIEEIRNAIIMDCEGFYLRYQPVIDANTEQMIGAEVLLGWQNHRYGDVAPTVYIPALEQDYIFEELGYWILRRVMHDMRRILAKDKAFTVGINIAPAQLLDELFADGLLNIARQAGVPLTNICLELTAGCRLIEKERLLDIVSYLQARGVRFLIDDFGSGYASIEFLRDISPEFVKIDGRYVKNIAADDRGRRLLRSMVEMAAAYGTKVCLKGIETKEIQTIVKAYALRGLQGYFYDRPLSLSALLQKYFS